MRTRLIFILILCGLVGTVQAAENIRKIGTWNMKWLGMPSGSQLDPIENVPEYASYILSTGATLFALQEIGATHSVAGQPRCAYLDFIVQGLNHDIVVGAEQWAYCLDDKNSDRRLAFLYKQDQWSVSNAHTEWPGSSYKSARRPFIATVEAKGDNAALKFTYICVHFKAFDDADSEAKRKANVSELAAWLQAHSTELDGDVLIAGDTNIYQGEQDTDKPLKDIGYTALYDQELSCIHEGEINQRFDRFFCSADLKKEIDSAKGVVVVPRTST